MTIHNYQPAKDLLKDRVILVTGAGDGIGAVAAQTFAAHGAVVVLLGRTVRKLEAVYDAIKKAGGPEPAIYPLNLEGANFKDYQDMAAVISRELGGLNGILHNAALLGDITPVAHYDVQLWHRVLQVNVNAPYMLTRACLGLLQSSADPRIVFTAHRVEQAYWGAYGVSKAASLSLMHVLADELSEHRRITVNAIEPGHTQSPLMARAYPGKDLKSLPPIQTIMPAYLYLFGPDSAAVTGQILPAQVLPEAEQHR
jgi:NAD(P)-dependent dehydrogenase (short-subunit alcohol dehydrogenase family)